MILRKKKYRKYQKVKNNDYKANASDCISRTQSMHSTEYNENDAIERKKNILYKDTMKRCIWLHLKGVTGNSV